MAREEGQNIFNRELSVIKGIWDCRVIEGFPYVGMRQCKAGGVLKRQARAWAGRGLYHSLLRNEEGSLRVMIKIHPQHCLGFSRRSLCESSECAPGSGAIQLQTGFCFCSPMGEGREGQSGASPLRSECVGGGAEEPALNFAGAGPVTGGSQSPSPLPPC